MDHKRNIVLIGIPGAGRSTVGILTAMTTWRIFLVERSLCRKGPSGYLGFSWSNEVQWSVSADSAEDGA
jgi:hypothetical protein